MSGDKHESASRMTYPPLDTLKPVCPDIWIVDGPAVRFGAFGLTVPFPTRMTLIRIEDGRLFVHSPTRLTEALKQEVAEIGTPAWIIGPNRLHYTWLTDWHDAYPQAQISLAPKVESQARKAFPFAHELGRPGAKYPWEGQIDTLAVEGRFMTEMIFFHKASRTLVLTDFIENFDPAKVDSGFVRLLARLGGVLDPDGAMPVDMRFSYSKCRLQAAVRTLIGWNPERIILSHGRWYTHDGQRELKRAFRWLGI